MNTCYLMGMVMQEGKNVSKIPKNDQARKLATGQGSMQMQGSANCQVSQPFFILLYKIVLH